MPEDASVSRLRGKAVGIYDEQTGGGRILKGGALDKGQTWTHLLRLYSSDEENPSFSASSSSASVPADAFSEPCAMPMVAALEHSSDDNKADSPAHRPWSDSEGEQVLAPAPSQVPSLLSFEPDPGGRILLPPWNAQRFRFWKVHMLAARSGGQVELYLDLMTGGTVAVKHLPRSRLTESPQAYQETWPGEVENPWKEIEIMMRFGLPGPDRLTCVARSFGAFCTERGDGMLVSEYLPGGDLFDIAAKLDEPGLKRELQVCPIIMSLIQAVRALHARGVAHGDISLENALLKRGSQVVLVDFAMAVTENTDAATGRRGKPSYMAPEMFTQRSYDARAADVFACGVCAYALAMGSYPWVSTRPGACLAFVFAQRFGLQALLQRRRLAATPRRPRTPIGACMSPAFRHNLVAMLAMDSARRPKLHEYVSYEVLQKGWASTD